MTKSIIMLIISGGLMVTVPASANTQTFSVGYAQSKVQDFKHIRGINAQYRYEWNSSPLSVIGSFTYMKGDDSNSYYDEEGDYYKNHADVKYYSLLAGPAYRVNDYFSFYGLIGVAHTKADGGYEWLNSVGSHELDGHESGNLSGKSTNFAFAAGVQINPTANLSVNVGYEGSNADIYGKHKIDGFNVGFGYRF
ncbi:Ail/Lom family outer membrane beta-barrel protein [Morganella morganii]|uniref:Ail/Lom family outer membrane beta-barrel protein n=1 Tax=Morganella morganii TaxID=582 RepID=UPI002297CFB6|nr:Ail/Lom family outer membrane beta-barrel protein [Morganella morganii]ELB1110578.1 Ail/Lom family outer membrane beta-barrel protein [Morganella morganii]HCR3555922.1 Ail/Lom family outer membrane beta-barrel protein [Morganella morganii]HCR3760859.1 Ail/Lom family outer membrane beta-barrel protein [Morganella morganii]HCT5327298.1 Ail/Lom family outer membrane beta-barrel protein [Morganella morganii]